MIHKYSLKGYNIVLDVNSGAVHIVSPVFYDLLDIITLPMQSSPESSVYTTLTSYSAEEIDSAWSEIHQLINDDALFSVDDYDQYADKMILSPVKAMCLNVSHDCNLRCEYCFAGKGDYDGTRMVMNLETGKKAIDFLIEHSHGRENLEVDFFGGEPLMNMKVVRGVVDYARSKENEHGKNFRFTITTNGVLLSEENIAYINREMSNVVLSLDGRKGVNDRVRSRVGGGGSYDSIVPKFQSLVQQRGDKEYYVRGTFTKYNKDFAEDITALNELGFDQISIEPVVSDPAQPYALSMDDLPQLFSEYERLGDIILDARKKGNGYNFFHYMLDLDQGPCAIKRLRGCGCGNEYVAITPDGDIYPCHQFIGQDDRWKMGNVYDGTFDLETKKMFSRNSVNHKEDCRECWAKFYCSGGCSANNQQYCGDISKPVELSCELEKKRLEVAIVMKAQQLEEE